jgi:hypothetical protein
MPSSKLFAYDPFGVDEYGLDPIIAAIALIQGQEPAIINATMIVSYSRLQPIMSTQTLRPSTACTQTLATPDLARPAGRDKVDGQGDACT